MHGLINRTLQCFLSDTYGAAVWRRVVQRAELGFAEFEAMLHYEEGITNRVLSAAVAELDKPRDAILEDVGTYLVSHPNTEGLRRLMRFGGVDFVEFLHSLDDLPERARLAVPDLDLPDLELREEDHNHFTLFCRASVDGFGHVLMGTMRAMADDYGALVILDHHGRDQGRERVTVTLIETAFSEGRTFDLGTPARERRQTQPGSEKAGT